MKITGLKEVEQKVIKNKKGDIIKFISTKSSFYKKFGEVYFTEVVRNKIKGWNYHKKNQCIFCVPMGKVQFHFIDGRKKSKTYFKEIKITISRKKPGIIKVPNQIWFSFKSLEKVSLIANFLEKSHTKNETIKKSLIKNYLIK
jgi:dTDP-4-dehydrorhamnose 3,5-epimerase-like enzyme|tara:strand:- start:3 stop:431 length:429 start_codon:yes stop_codon:yes gene_type:complete